MSHFTEFRPEIWNAIETEMESHFNQCGPPYYAAFDADGTLWDGDAGETFFHYQIAHCQLKGLPEKAWDHYHAWKLTDPLGAYLWLAQINEGQTLAQVRAWAQNCMREHPQWPVFPAQKRLIHWLKGKGVRVFVVTASIKWAVEPLAPLLGLHYDDVIGVQTEVVDGIITPHQKGPITWKEGKAEALLTQTQGVAPLFCSGNTMGDAALIGCSRLLKMAVTYAKPGDEIFETELSLQKLARENNWLSHSFR